LEHAHGSIYKLLIVIGHPVPLKNFPNPVSPLIISSYCDTNKGVGLLPLTPLPEYANQAVSGLGYATALARGGVRADAGVAWMRELSFGRVFVLVLYLAHAASINTPLPENMTSAHHDPELLSILPFAPDAARPP
jgi:hypothetical protein